MKGGRSLHRPLSAEGGNARERAWLPDFRWTTLFAFCSDVGKRSFSPAISRLFQPLHLGRFHILHRPIDRAHHRILARRRRHSEDECGVDLGLGWKMRGGPTILGIEGNGFPHWNHDLTCFSGELGEFLPFYVGKGPVLLLFRLVVDADGRKSQCNRSYPSVCERVLASPRMENSDSKLPLGFTRTGDLKRDRKNMRSKTFLLLALALEVETYKCRDSGGDDQK